MTLETSPQPPIAGICVCGMFLRQAQCKNVKLAVYDILRTVCLLVLLGVKCKPLHMLGRCSSTQLWDVKYLIPIKGCGR